MFGAYGPEECSDPHDECRFEIHRLEARVKALKQALVEIANRPDLTPAARMQIAASALQE